MNLVLMLLVISLELVELSKHDRLFRVEVSTDAFADVGDEGDHDREGLGGESCTGKEA
jgi:hypothetical protein